MLQRTVVILAAIFLLVSCTGEHAPSGSEESSKQQPKNPPAAVPQDQVLSDVIANAFPTGGPSARRGMRMAIALNNITARRCGGLFLDLSSTSERIDQATYPDLELIAQRGLSERSAKERASQIPGPAMDAMNEKPDGTSDPNVKAATDHQAIVRCSSTVVKSYGEYSRLGDEWMRDTLDAQKDPSLKPLLADAAACLRAQSDLVISQQDPLNDFLLQADQAAIDGKSTRPFALTYANCTAGYFTRLQQLLEVRQDAAVARHRDMLESVASDVRAAGYVP